MRHHHHPLSQHQASRPPAAIPRQYNQSEETLEQFATRTAMTMGGGSKTTSPTTPRPGNSTTLQSHTAQLSHLPTPPSSFNSTSSSVHSYSYEPHHRQGHGPSSNSTLTPKRVASLRASPVEQRQLLPQPSSTLRASHPPKQMADTPYLPRSPSLSPEPLCDELLFPTINFGSPRSSPHSSPRSSPERDLELHTSSRESSPESYRESPVPLPPSPKHPADATGCSRSRSSSPLDTLRPPQIPLPPDAEGVYGPMLSGRGRGRGSAASSVASFDMLASYGSIPASAAASDKKELEKMVQQQGMPPPVHHRTYPQFERHLGYVFKPNTGLAKEITPSFIGTYATPRDRRMSESRSMGPPPLPQGGSKRSQSDPAKRGTHSPVDSVSSLEFPFRRKREREVSEEPLQEEVDSSYELQKIKMEDTMASDPTVSEQSGIPSYCEEFERDRKVQQWQYENGTFFFCFFVLLSVFSESMAVPPDLFSFFFLSQLPL
ncbi:hypothetical protein EX30DRAFT_43120 [Ascodesmis nigricans]|uniref:Uncharacterized protein n=1 Tax=Ascodesmis nigricans TaxID=341454 RepID=A0A4S2MW59_9PEZI|nr:hypothetical protein EX30DRAFT_43120 [Ascodesmis nigricans]